MITLNETLQLDVQDWLDLLVLPEREAVERLAAYYRKLAREDAGSIEKQSGFLVERESILGPTDHRKMLRLRLLAWTALEPRIASTVVMGHQAAMARMPADPAMREVACVQSIVAELPLADQTRLRALLPDRFLGALARSLAIAPIPERKPAKWRRFFSREAGPAASDATSVEPAS